MRQRLVASIAAVAAAAVLLLALPLGVVLQRSYRDQERLQLQRDTVAATRAVDLSSFARGDQVELPRSSGELAVYDSRGARVAGAGPPRADAVVRSTLRSGRPADLSEGGELRAAAPLLARERVLGALRATRDQGAVARRTRRAWLLLAGIGAGAVLLAAAAALVLGRRLARPLERLSVAARRLGDGDFSVRAPQTGVAEVDAVATALDATAVRLDKIIGRERTFSADASHQLRTPLAAMRLELEALTLSSQETPELKAALVQVERLQATIDTLLSVARDAPAEGRHADLVALVAAAEGRWHGPLAAAGRPLRIRIDEREASARATPGVVSEVLDVLVDNASRHGTGPVTVVLRAAAGSLAVDVGDEGPGFGGDPELAFKRGTGKGRGIGLALARSLAQAEGGRLLVTRGGRRPVLTFLLPAHPKP